MTNDLVADLLTRIRNAQRARHRAVRVVNSKLTKDVLSVMKTEGFIEGFDLKANEETGFDTFEVVLKYFDDGDPVISSCDRVSKSGRRIYKRSQDLTKIRSGLGISIVSTSEGVMSDREAKKRKIGGEVLATVS